MMNLTLEGGWETEEGSREDLHERSDPNSQQNHYLLETEPDGSKNARAVTCSSMLVNVSM
jgi:hypothetical protein